MYLQITTKCNMVCAHCCYSCRPGKGTHMGYSTAIAALSYIEEHDEIISIGGGEPTMHPRFFDILRLSLNAFDHVWLATNGSKTASMLRLAAIMDGFDEPGCSCDTEYGCDCYTMNGENLYVDLSQDSFHDHDKVAPLIRNLWTRRARAHGRSQFSIRDVSRSVAAQGRAKRTGAGYGDHCVCPDFIIKPDGSIKACGCTKSPTIGDIWDGVKPAYHEMLETEKFQDTRCFFGR